MSPAEWEHMCSKPCGCGVSVGMCGLLVLLFMICRLLASLMAGSSLGWMNRGTSKRSVWDPCGDVMVESVRDGNLFVTRTGLPR